MVSRTHLELLAVAATGTLGAAAWLWQRQERPRRAGRRPTNVTLTDCARRLDRGARLLSAAVLADSTLEHYRGGFERRAMYAPLAISGLSLLASQQGVRDRTPHAGHLRHAIAIASVVTGLTGTGFHLYNITKRPGGFGWSNLFYAAPLGAPGALVLTGALAYYAERLRGEERHVVPRIFGLPTGQSLALMSAAGLLAMSAEAGLLHFRGAFQNPAMYLPVSAPPLAAGLLAASALNRRHERKLRRLARFWLRFTALMGLAGSAFHALGVARNHGGWRNWRQTVQAGPPLPAPPAFTGLAIAGLAAERLLDEERAALASYRWWT